VTELPEQLAAFARAVTGGIVRISDRSWPRAGSAIWEVTDRAGRAWFVKRHSSERFHQREVSAYQRWTAALGPGRAPELAAADGRILAIVITGLPGLLARDLVVPAAEERELHRQAGELLRRLHDAAPPAAAGPGPTVQRIEEDLARAGMLLTTPEAALVRRCAADLRSLLPGLPMVPTHGDVQPRNLLWDGATRRLAMLDFERAAPGPAVADQVRLAYGPWDRRPAVMARTPSARSRPAPVAQSRSRDGESCAALVSTVTPAALASCRAAPSCAAVRGRAVWMSQPAGMARHRSVVRAWVVRSALGSEVSVGRLTAWTGGWRAYWTSEL